MMIENILKLCNVWGMNIVNLVNIMLCCVKLCYVVEFLNLLSSISFCFLNIWHRLFFSFEIFRQFVSNPPNLIIEAVIIALIVVAASMLMWVDVDVVWSMIVVVVVLVLAINHYDLVQNCYCFH